MSEPVKPCLYTIGHSTHELPQFLSLLTPHAITAIADVRSHPYSRFSPQYNRENVVDALRQAAIQYVYLGHHLGARRVERESYEENQARYDLVACLPSFREGLERLKQCMASHKVALLCAEKDPLYCHRAILVCRHLRDGSIEIRHILENGTIETHEQAESRLLEVVGLPTEDLFAERQELVELAYDIQGKRIAYVERGASPIASGGTS